MELFLDVLSETLVDTAKMLPFLFLAYLFIEYVETRHGERIETLLGRGAGRGAGLCAAVRLLGYRLQLLRLPRHHAGYADGRLSRHQRRGYPPAGVHARLLG